MSAAALVRDGDVGGVREALASGSPLPGLLHVAAEEDQVEILELLVEAGAPLSEVDEDGQTALHVAVANGLVDAAEVLSRTQPCHELGVPDIYKMTPLHLACETNEPEMLALILARGGDDIMKERRRQSISQKRQSINNKRTSIAGIAGGTVGAAASGSAPPIPTASSALHQPPSTPTLDMSLDAALSQGLSLDMQIALDVSDVSSRSRRSDPERASGGSSHRWSTSTDGSFGFIAKRHSNEEGVDMLRRASRGQMTQLPKRLSDAGPSRRLSLGLDPVSLPHRLSEVSSRRHSLAATGSNPSLPQFPPLLEGDGERGSLFSPSPASGGARKNWG